MSDSIYSINGKTYINKKSITLYPTTGSADDWFYSDDANEFNGDFRTAVFTIELRDTGSYGFLLPPKEVRVSQYIVNILSENVYDSPKLIDAS